jgi:hypothetical protein
LARAEPMGSMTGKADHIAWAAEAVDEFQRRCHRHQPTLVGTPLLA